MGSRNDGIKIHVELTPHTNTNKQYYAGVKNDNTRDSQTRETSGFQIDTDSCERNLDEE